MSEIKVNKISPKQTCTQLTLGDSGDTIIIPAGATIQNSGTATGFGATGAVNWDTTPKTTTVTAVSGTGYFVDTTSAAITVNLPAATAGDIVAISDYANTAATNNITVTPNGSQKIQGSNSNFEITVNGGTVTLVYVDSTQGWRPTDAATASSITEQALFIVATGGTITTCGNYKIHTFTGPGTFTVCSVGNPVGSTTVDYLVVAGGGGGGGQQPGDGGGGAGAGGFRTSITTVPTGAPPLSNPVAMPVSVTAYPITVGGGGTGGIACAPLNPASNGTPGNNSIFNTITSSGGGAGEGANNGSSTPVTVGRGGSGGGAHQGWACQPYPSSVGFPGNFPSVSPPQGNRGGDGQATPNGGGGGGAGAVGGNAAPGPGVVPAGGDGGEGSYVPNSWIGPTAPSYGTPGPVGSTRYFAGGGGGGNSPTRGGQIGNSGGAGGGGAGGVAGTTNTGGGGGAGQPSPSNDGKTGGSGIVIIRYKYQ